MKTVEEFLEQSGYHEKVVHPLQGEIRPTFQHLTVKTLMEEYSKQEAIEFGKWLLDEFEPGVYDEDEHENLYEPLYQEDYEKNSYRMEELYEIWKHDTPSN